MFGDRIFAVLSRLDGMESRFTLLERRDAMRRIAARADAEFREGDHPRETDGRFAGKGGGSASQSVSEEAWASQGKRPPFANEDIAHLPSTATHRKIKTWDQLATHGPKAQREFVGALHGVAQRLGLKTDVGRPEDFNETHLEDASGYLVIAPPKGEARAREKIDNEYGGRAGHLKDYLRASIAVSNISELREAVAAVEGAGLKMAQKPKDNFSHPRPSGYRDLNTVVRLPGGMVAEVQYHVKPMMAAKVAGHPHYEVDRALSAKHGLKPREEWPEEDRKAQEEALVSQQELYGEAWAKATQA